MDPDTMKINDIIGGLKAILEPKLAKINQRLSALEVENAALKDELRRLRGDPPKKTQALFDEDEWRRVYDEQHPQG
jgi:predicted nuclease with TOPRIM domain